MLLGVKELGEFKSLFGRDLKIYCSEDDPCFSVSQIAKITGKTPSLDKFLQDVHYKTVQVRGKKKNVFTEEGLYKFLCSASNLVADNLHHFISSLLKQHRAQHVAKLEQSNAQIQKAASLALEQNSELKERIKNLENKIMYVYEIRRRGDVSRQFPFYIGSTERSIQERFISHKTAALSHARDALDRYAIELGYEQLEVLERAQKDCISKKEIEDMEYELIREETRAYSKLILNKKKRSRRHAVQTQEYETPINCVSRDDIMAAKSKNIIESTNLLILKLKSGLDKKNDC